MATSELTPLEAGDERVHDFSRFRSQDFYIENRRKFWGTWQPPEVPSSPEDVFITITEADESRLDLVAYRFYKTPELWWVLALVNDLFFPPEELVIGTILRVPSKTTLNTLGLIP